MRAWLIDLAPGVRHPAPEAGNETAPEDWSERHVLEGCVGETFPECDGSNGRARNGPPTPDLAFVGRNVETRQQQLASLRTIVEGVGSRIGVLDSRGSTLEVRIGGFEARIQGRDDRPEPIEQRASKRTPDPGHRGQERPAEALPETPTPPSIAPNPAGKNQQAQARPIK